MKKVIFCLLALLILSACNANKNEKIQAFWLWFDKNKSHFEELTHHNKNAKLTALVEQLRQIDGGLSAEVSTDLKQLIISAGGDTSKFNLVQEIVRTAPSLEDWDVTAFRQPAIEDFTLQFEDITLTPSELYFLPVEDNDKLDIIVYGIGLGKYDYKKLTHYGLLMLDKVMGEYNSAKLVRYYDFKDIADVKKSEDLIPLNEINDYVEAFHAVRGDKSI